MNSVSISFSLSLFHLFLVSFADPFSCPILLFFWYLFSIVLKQEKEDSKLARELNEEEYSSTGQLIEYVFLLFILTLKFSFFFSFLFLIVWMYSCTLICGINNLIGVDVVLASMPLMTYVWSPLLDCLFLFLFLFRFILLFILSLNFFNLFYFADGPVSWWSFVLWRCKYTINSYYLFIFIYFHYWFKFIYIFYFWLLTPNAVLQEGCGGYAWVRYAQQKEKNRK